jgi:maleylacetoacetate isomerase
MSMKLYSYWRSSAAYRVRIALNLKHLNYDIVPVSLLPKDAEHRKDDYRQRNPQMLLPFLEDGEVRTGQSMAILEYLEEAYPSPPLLPTNAHDRAAVRSFSHLICCDIHPLNNLRVMQYLKNEIGTTDKQFDAWYAHWINEGFAAAEIVATQHRASGPFVFGADVTFADTCLIPQMYNALRFNVPLDRFPRLLEINSACNEMDSFQEAYPQQP